MGKYTTQPSEVEVPERSSASPSEGLSRRADMFSPTNGLDPHRDAAARPRLKLSDFVNLVRRSSAGIACVTFPKPIPLDAPSPAAFADQLYNAPSTCIEASESLALSQGKPTGRALIGRPLREILPPQLRFDGLLAEWFRRRFSSDGFQCEAYDLSGRPIKLHAAVYGSFDNEALTRLWVIIRDITALDRAIHAATKTERHYRSLFDHPDLVFLRTYTDGTLSFATPETRRILHLDESTGKTIDDVLRSACHPSDRDALAQLAYHRHSLSRDPLTVSVRLVSLTHGLTTYTLHQHAHIFDDQVDTYDIFGVGASQATLASNQDMPSTILAAGLAHDANNHLTVASTSIELALQILSKDDPATALLRSAIRSLADCASINANSINLSKGIHPCSESILIRDLLADLAQQARASLPPGITLVSSVENDLLRVSADRTHLSQALLNLVLNARDALGSGGVITLTATPRASLITNYSSGAGPAVCVSVSDNGPGIPDALRENLFQPFTSTKSGERTRGLGLAMVRALIEMNGGQVAVTSAPGVGTTFTLTLPGSIATATSDFITLPTPSLTSPLSLHSLRMLIADDEYEVRRTLLLALSSRGHQVTAVPDSRSLMSEITKPLRTYDIVIVDDGMPGSSASDISRALNTLDSSLPVVVTSGNVSLEGQLPALEGRRFLAKPFTLEDLFKAVESLSRSNE